MNSGIANAGTATAGRAEIQCLRRSSKPVAKSTARLTGWWRTLRGPTSGHWKSVLWRTGDAVHRERPYPGTWGIIRGVLGEAVQLCSLARGTPL